MTLPLRGIAENSAQCGKAVDMALLPVFNLLARDRLQIGEI